MRHPVLLAVDDFQALYCTSNYRNPDFNRIQSHHLSTPRMLLEYAGGLKSFVSIFFRSLVAFLVRTLTCSLTVARRFLGSSLFYKYDLYPSIGAT